MNFLSAHQSSNPTTPATQSVSGPIDGRAFLDVAEPIWTKDLVEIARTDAATRDLQPAGLGDRDADNLDRLVAGQHAFHRHACKSGATPTDIIGKLNAAAVEALADQAIRSRLVELGFEIFPREQQTPKALGALQKADAEKWWPIIKEFGIKGQ
jgi:hypothetical protein